MDTICRRQTELDRVARALHSGVGQTLTVVGLHLDMLRQDCEGQSAELLEKLTAIHSLLDQAGKGVRDLARDVRSGSPVHLGLRNALGVLIDKTRRRMDEAGAKTSIELRWNASAGRPQELAAAYYQIAGYALENAERHAGAGEILVAVDDEGPGIVMRLTDNGRGFDVGSATAEPIGVGLIWMHHTASRNGLRCVIESSPDAGTAVTVTQARAGGKDAA